MESEFQLKPWILNTVRAEKCKCLARKPPNARAIGAVTVEYRTKRLIQILDFGGQKKPPFNRLSISDSKTRILSRLSERARKEIQKSAGSRPPSQTEGAVCELIHYSLIFDSKTTDGVIVDIHELKYKGGACQKSVGTPRRIMEQSSTQSPEDMASRRRSGDSSPRHELDEVFSQTQFMSDAGANSSENEEIATQVPRKKGSFSKSHYVGGGVTVTEGILNVLESFQERKTAIKRLSSISGDLPVEERTRKRQHLEQSPKSAPSPAAQNDDREYSSFGDDSTPSKNAKDNAILDNTMVRTSQTSAVISSTNQVHTAQDMEIQQIGGIPHNTALSDHFHIGLKLLPKRFVSPPKSQLQYLVHARYVNPKIPAEKQFVGVSSCALQELRIHPATVETSSETISEAAPKQKLEDDAEEMNIAFTGYDEDVTYIKPRRPSPSVSSTNSDKTLAEDTHQENDDDLSNATDEAISWASSPVRPVRARDDLLPTEMVQKSAQASPDKHTAISLDGFEDSREPESSPSRLPSLKPLSAPHIWPMAWAGSKNVTSMNQVPSSSPGLEDELEQQVPIALDSPGAYPHVSIKSPSSTSRIMLSSPRSPAVQIGRSPHPDEIKKDAKRSLLLAAVSKGTYNAVTHGTRAISSDPIIPATFEDYKETAASERGIENQALQAASPDTWRGITHRILVPATIPSRAANAFCAQMLDSSWPDNPVIHSTAGRNGRTSLSTRPNSERALDNPETRRDSISVGDERPQTALKSKMDWVNIPTNTPSRRKAKLIAPNFSQLSSSVDTTDMARANRRSFFAQPDEHGEGDLDEAARIRSTSANLGSGGPKGDLAAPGLKSTRCSTTPSARVIQSYLGSGRLDSLQVDSNSKEMKDMVDRRPSPPAFVSPSRGAVFEKFKLAYPQFWHDRSKFIMACSYIKWLRDNRKVMPVHQSLFDDFIRVFCGPYSEYVRDLSASDLPTETPVDFYNRFLEPVFTSRIVTLATLGEALESNADLAAKHSKRLRRISSRFAPLSATTATLEQQEQLDLAVSSIGPLHQAAIDLEAPMEHELDHRPDRMSSPILGEVELAHDDAMRRAEPSTGPRQNRLKKLRQSESKRAVVSTPMWLNFTTPKVTPVDQVVILDQRGTPTQIYIPHDDMEVDLLPKDVPERRGRNRYSLPVQGSHE